MLQAILDGQAAIWEYIREGFKKIDIQFEKLDKKMDGVEQRLTVRLDKLGKQLAYLEDDTPTREENDKLEERVAKVEKTISS